MFTNLCECLFRINTPGINEVLDVINRNTVCTNTQCFETNQDAGFGINTIHTTNDNSTLFFLTILILFIYLTMNIPTSLSSKPNNILHQHNHIEDVD